MKKVIILLSMLFILFSCGDNTEKQDEQEQEQVNLVEENKEIEDEEVKNEEIESDNQEEVEIKSKKLSDSIKEKIIKEESKNTEETNISIEEISKHSKSGDCYTAIDGKVYDVSSFFGKHPGGDDNLLKTCGKDATELFNTQHGANEKAKIKKDEFYIGNFE